MKKMTTPKQLALPYFIGKVALVLSTFLLLTSATMLVQAPQPRVPFPDFQNSLLPVSDFVERYDALMINDPTAGFLDAEAEYLARIVQRVLGYTGGFKTYEFRMYGPSLAANGEIAFETAAGSFADKIENGGVVAVRGKGGQPELRKVTQNAYYLMIAMQAQGGDAVKFKVVLKLPKKAGVSDAEHATMEGALGRIGEAELLSQWNKRMVLAEAGIAEAKGTRKIADMLEKWTPGQPIASEQIQELLMANGFYSQKVNCANFSVDAAAAPGVSGNVEYYSHITVHDTEASSPSLRLAEVVLHSHLLSSAFNTELEKLGKFSVNFIITSDKDFQTVSWDKAKRSFDDRKKKVIVWIHYSGGGCNGNNLRSDGGDFANLAINVRSNLSEDEVANLGTGNLFQNGSCRLDEQATTPWAFLQQWRAKCAWLDNFQSENNDKLFAFGVVCGMIDQALDRLNELVEFVSSSTDWLKGLSAELEIAGAKLTKFILQAIQLGVKLHKYLPGTGQNIDAFIDKNAESVNLLIDELSVHIDELIARQQTFRTQIKAIWDALLDPNTYRQFAEAFIQSIKTWLGNIQELFTDPNPSVIKNLGYGIGKELMDMAISWLTAGASKLLTGAFSKICGSLKSASAMVKENLIDGSRAIAGNGSDYSKNRERFCASKLGCFISGTLVLTTLGAQPIEALNPANPIPQYIAATNSPQYDPSTTTEFGIQALNAAHTLPGDVKDIDREEITPATWRWLHLSYTKPDGTTAQVYLRRPLWWMQHHGARAPGDHITLLMPEMGIVGRAQLEAILPSTLDTRSWDYRAQGDYAHYPLTGFFAHESAEVWDLYFSASKQPVGATYNHPFYSTDRAQYVYAGELALGERILTQSGDTVQFLLKRPHAGLSTKVYNLEVWRAHNFLVTEKGMVVHNNGCMVEVMGDGLLCFLENCKKILSNSKLIEKLEADLVGNSTLTSLLKGNPNLVKAWEILEADPNMRIDKDFLMSVETYLATSNKSILDLSKEFKDLPDQSAKLWWAKNAHRFLDFDALDFPRAMNHVKYRDINVDRKKGIGGCHDENEWAKIWQEDAATYQIPIGKTKSDVPEVLVKNVRIHPTTPGVKIVEYGIPALDGRNLTDGNIKAISNPKTLYNPSIWTDDKLQQALKEAVQDAANNNGGLLNAEWVGSTRHGVLIRGYFRDGKIDSFFFN